MEQNDAMFSHYVKQNFRSSHYCDKNVILLMDKSHLNPLVLISKVEILLVNHSIPLELLPPNDVFEHPSCETRERFSAKFL